MWVLESAIVVAAQQSRLLGASGGLESRLYVLRSVAAEREVGKGTRPQTAYESAGRRSGARAASDGRRRRPASHGGAEARSLLQVAA